MCVHLAEECSCTCRAQSRLTQQRFWGEHSAPAAAWIDSSTAGERAWACIISECMYAASFLATV